MLQAINDRIKGWLGIAIVILIGLPFALWGINSYFEDSGPKFAAKVNDIEISANELERTVSLQRQRLQIENEGELPVEEKELRETTLSQLINQKLLESSAYENGYRISDSIVASRIKQQFTVDGVFDRIRFETSVASLGMSVPMYEDALRNELRVNQMRVAIAKTAFVTNKELDTLAKLNEQTRDISVLNFNIESFAADEKPTQEEVSQYYEENRQRYMVPEKIKIDYVEITSELLTGDIEIDEAQIQQMYDAYVTSVSNREERKARHILLQSPDDTKIAKAATKAKLEALKEEIEEGADFAELAKEYSQDTASAADGGDLGWVALGVMAQPFENALFELELVKDSSGKSSGAISNVVETQFGYHLIMLEDVRSETPEPLEIKRYTFEEELKSDAISSRFFDISERLAALAYENPDSLDIVVEELGLELKTSDEFSRTKGSGIAENQLVRNIAFSPLVLEDGSNSDIVEISPTHVAVVRLNEHTPEKPIPLDEVASDIQELLVAKNAAEKTKAAAEEIKTKIEAGEAIESFKSDNVTLEVVKDLGRNDTSKVSAPLIVHHAFTLPFNKDGKPSAKVVDLLLGGIALVVLTDVKSPETIDDSKLASVKAGIERQTATTDFTTILSSIKNNTNIEKNERLLEQ